MIRITIAAATAALAVLVFTGCGNGAAGSATDEPGGGTGSHQLAQ